MKILASALGNISSLVGLYNQCCPLPQSIFVLRCPCGLGLKSSVIVPHGSGRLWKLGKTNSSKRIQLLLINRKLHPLSCFLTLTQISLISQERNHICQYNITCIYGSFTFTGYIHTAVHAIDIVNITCPWFHKHGLIFVSPFTIKGVGSFVLSP